MFVLSAVVSRRHNQMSFLKEKVFHSFEFQICQRRKAVGV